MDLSGRFSGTTWHTHTHTTSHWPIVLIRKKKKLFESIEADGGRGDEDENTRQRRKNPRNKKKKRLALPPHQKKKLINRKFSCGAICKRVAPCRSTLMGTASERSLFTVARHNFLWRVSAHHHQRKATLLLFLSTHNYFCPPPSLLRERESGKMLLSTSPFCVHQLCWRGGGTFFFCPPFLTPSVDTRATGARDFSLFTLCLINTPSLLRQTPPSLPPENKNKTKQKKTEGSQNYRNFYYWIHSHTQPIK